VPFLVPLALNTAAPTHADKNNKPSTPTSLDSNNSQTPDGEPPLPRRQSLLGRLFSWGKRDSLSGIDASNAFSDTGSRRGSTANAQPPALSSLSAALIKVVGVIDGVMVRAWMEALPRTITALDATLDQMVDESLSNEDSPHTNDISRDNTSSSTNLAPVASTHLDKVLGKLEGDASGVSARAMLRAVLPPPPRKYAYIYAHSYISRHTYDPLSMPHHSNHTCIHHLFP